MIKVLTNDYTENTYIINEGNVGIIIDPGMNIEVIDEYITKHDITLEKILLTHGHFDHIISVNDVMDKYQIPVYIHEKERDFLFDPNLNLSSTTYRNFKVTNKAMVHTFIEDTVFQLGNKDITIMHTPGHTRGSVCYHFKNYLFSGDTLFKDTIGRTDLPTSNSYEMDQSIKKIIEHYDDNTVVYPGHGHFTTILSEKYNNPFVKK